MFYHLSTFLSGWTSVIPQPLLLYLPLSVSVNSHLSLSLFSVFPFMMHSEESHIWDSYSSVPEDSPYSTKLFFPISTQKYSKSCTFWGHGLSIHTFIVIFHQWDSCIITKYSFLSYIMWLLCFVIFRWGIPIVFSIINRIYVWIFSQTQPFFIK